MSIPLPLSSSVLQVVQPLRESLGSGWESVLAGLTVAPDPELAAANLRRLLEGGKGSGVVLAAADLCRDLLFVLGASQHLANVLCRQGDQWEDVFLADRCSSLTSCRSGSVLPFDRS